MKHVTEYHYSAPVSHSVNQLCLTPRTTGNQVCLSSTLQVSPQPGRISSISDYYGNTISKFSLEQNHRECVITVIAVVDTADVLSNLPPSPYMSQIKSLVAGCLSDDGLMAQDCLLPSLYVPYTAQATEVLSEIGCTDLPILEFAQALMTWIYSEFEYDAEFSTLVTPITDVLSAKKGVCQDFVHLAIAVLRYAGIPARYVSGYMETMPPAGQKKLQGSDATHAWFSVYVPNAGWYDFDPTNNKRPDAQYITTAWGRDYADVAPLVGVVFGGGETTLNVAVDVDRMEKGLSVVDTQSDLSSLAVKDQWNTNP